MSDGQLLGDTHPNKCPRCGGAMVCYVSSPIAWGAIERRLYFSCRCGMIDARNEEDVVTCPAAHLIED